MKKIALLGSTGSIGKQVLDVVDKYRDLYEVVAISANSNYVTFQDQMCRYKPAIAILSDPQAAARLTKVPKDTSLYYGENAYRHFLDVEVDLVFVAIMGFEGLKSVLYALKNGKDVALANKETLVAGGEIVTALAKKTGAKIIPVDSEHSAIWQCLGFDREKDFEKLIITASGGAFRDLKIGDLKSVKAADALKHPNWQMGKKITVDCATMVNKGLEVIEAKWLFNADYEKIEVALHPESVIHSMVQFKDGSVISQMAAPDMRAPIALALSYPNRLELPISRLDFTNLSLHFSEVDENRYPCFPLVLKAAKLGGNYPCALSAANEEAVKLFLEDKIGFLEIYDYISAALDKTLALGVSFDELLITDREARASVLERFKNR